ncbi:MAG: thermonuclease family protein [Devosia sp.]
MADITRYRRLKHADPELLPSLARTASARHRRERWTTAALMLAAFMASLIGGALLLSGAVRIPELAETQAPATVAGMTASFSICNSASRYTCVVDGDTFWLEGVKYRVADIDTPEVSQPGCAAERALGRRATQRFAELLNAGPFELGGYERDEDRYGRKLRIVRRGGESIGMMLVAEGLAHVWGGPQREWC